MLVAEKSLPKNNSGPFSPQWIEKISLIRYTKLLLETENVNPVDQMVLDSARNKDNSNLIRTNPKVILLYKNKLIKTFVSSQKHLIRKGKPSCKTS